MTKTPNETVKLNEAQKKAVHHTQGPLLILAGAGSGKTRVLTERAVHLISSGEASPDQIWAVTFTNKAAKEMERRIQMKLKQKQIPINIHSLWITTFHSGCARILRQHAPCLGYPSLFCHL